MPGRATDLIEIEDSFWERADVIEALRRRDIGHLFRLLAQFAGASQTRLAIACDMTQPRSADTCGGPRRSKTLEVFERIADGLNMPSHAPIALGLAPKTDPAAASPAAGRAEPDIPPRNTRPALPAAAFSGLLSAGAGDSEEDEPSVRRRTFVGLTGASLFGVILADTARGGPADAIESFAAVLAAYSSDMAGAALDTPRTWRRWPPPSHGPSAITKPAVTRT